MSAAIISYLFGIQTVYEMSVGEFAPCENCGHRFGMDDIMVVQAKLGRQWHVDCYYDKKALQKFVKNEIYLYTPRQGVLKVNVANIWVVVNTKLSHVEAFTHQDDAKKLLEKFNEAEKNEGLGTFTFIKELHIQ